MGTRGFSENAFFMFYGIFVGLLIGVFGNVWAQLFYDYVIKGSLGSNPDSIGILFWSATVLLVMFCAATVLYIRYFWRKTHHP